MFEEILNKKLTDATEKLTDSKVLPLNEKIDDLTSGIEIITDVVSEIPKMVDEKIAVIDAKISAVKIIKGEKGEPGVDGLDGKNGEDGIDGLDGSPDTVDEVLKKVNSKKGGIKSTSLEGFESLVNQTTLKGVLETLDNQTRYLIQKAAQQSSSGLTSVAHDATLTGDGTSGSPLSVVGLGTANLLEHQIGFGDASDLMTSSADLTYNTTTKVFNVGYSPDSALNLNFTSKVYTFGQAGTGTDTYLRLTDATGVIVGHSNIYDLLTLNGLTGTAQLGDSSGAYVNVDSVGNVIDFSTQYANTRDDTGSFTPTSFLYTNASGDVFVAPLSASTPTNIKEAVVGVVCDGQGTVVSTGNKKYFKIPYSGTITGWTIATDQTGSIVFDVWKSTGIPTVANTITAAAKPTLTAAQLATSTAVGTWTGLAVTAGDIFGFNVDSVSTVTWAILEINITKS